MTSEKQRNIGEEFEEAKRTLWASYLRFTKQTFDRTASFRATILSADMGEGESKIKGMTGTVILDECYDYQQTVGEEHMKKLAAMFRSGSVSLPPYPRNTGEELIEGLKNAIKYAKADVVLIKLEKEAEEILNSIDPPFYFAHSKWHELEEGMSIRVRASDGAMEYHAGPNIKSLTRAEAVNLIMLFQEMDDEDV